MVECHSKYTDYLDDMGINNKWRIGDTFAHPSEIRDKLLAISSFRENQILSGTRIYERKSP